MSKSIKTNNDDAVPSYESGDRLRHGSQADRQEKRAKKQVLTQEPGMTLSMNVCTFIQQTSPSTANRGEL